VLKSCRSIESNEEMIATSLLFQITKHLIECKASVVGEAQGFPCAKLQAAQGFIFAFHLVDYCHFTDLLSLLTYWRPEMHW